MTVMFFKETWLCAYQCNAPPTPCGLMTGNYVGIFPDNVTLMSVSSASHRMVKKWKRANSHIAPIQYKGIGWGFITPRGGAISANPHPLPAGGGGGGGGTIH